MNHHKKNEHGINTIPQNSRLIKFEPPNQSGSAMMPMDMTQAPDTVQSTVYNTVHNTTVHNTVCTEYVKNESGTHFLDSMTQLNKK